MAVSARASADEVRVVGSGNYWVHSKYRPVSENAPRRKPKPKTRARRSLKFEESKALLISLRVRTPPKPFTWRNPCIVLADRKGVCEPSVKWYRMGEVPYLNLSAPKYSAPSFTRSRFGSERRLGVSPPHHGVCTVNRVRCITRGAVRTTTRRSGMPVS